MAEAHGLGPCQCGFDSHRPYSIEGHGDARRHGQHRLAAIIEADLPVAVTVFTSRGYEGTAMIKTGPNVDKKFYQVGEALFRGGRRDTGLPACMACHGPSGRGNPGGAVVSRSALLDADVTTSVDVPSCGMVSAPAITPSPSEPIALGRMKPCSMTPRPSAMLPRIIAADPEPRVSDANSSNTSWTTRVDRAVIRRVRRSNGAANSCPLAA